MNGGRSVNWPQSRFSARYLSYNGHYRGLRSLSQLIGQSTRCSLKMMLEKNATAQPPTITAVKCVGPGISTLSGLGSIALQGKLRFSRRRDQDGGFAAHFWRNFLSDVLNPDFVIRCASRHSLVAWLRILPCDGAARQLGPIIARSWGLTWSHGIVGQ